MSEPICGVQEDNVAGDIGGVCRREPGHDEHDPFALSAPPTPDKPWRKGEPYPGGDKPSPVPLHGEIERLLIGMVRTSYPMDRTQYERGWNEALHAARKKVADLRSAQ